MPTPITDLSPEYVLLGLIAQKPAHGYELHQRLVTDLGQTWHISLSQTYATLNRLERRGLIAGTAQKPDKRPTRRSFRLTAAGRRRFMEWLHSVTRCSVRAIRVEFVARLYFAHTLGPDPTRQVLEAQRAEVEEGLVRLQSLLNGFPPEQVMNRLSLQLRIRQLGSVIEWLAQCKRALGLEP